jgi:hypothetical protein
MNKITIISPVPSAAQLWYQSTDFVALIHFNMVTYAKDGDPGCDDSNWNQKVVGAAGPASNPNRFYPYSKLNTTRWLDSITALGANITVLGGFRVDLRAIFSQYNWDGQRRSVRNPDFLRDKTGLTSEVPSFCSIFSTMTSS